VRKRKVNEGMKSVRTFWEKKQEKKKNEGKSQKKFKNDYHGVINRRGNLKKHSGKESLSRGNKLTRKLEKKHFGRRSKKRRKINEGKKLKEI
jgi:hypothetical protein